MSLYDNNTPFIPIPDCWEYDPLPFVPKERLPDEAGQKFIAARNCLTFLGLDLTIEQLAEKADVSTLDIRMWETGPRCLKPLQSILGAMDRHLVVTKERIILLDSSVIPMYCLE